MGYLGDGIVEVDGDGIYVFYMVFGDCVCIRCSGMCGMLFFIIEVGLNWVLFVCLYFLKCGGCFV